MARYKSVDMSPRLLPVDLEAQLVPGSFAHAVHHLVDALDLSAFDAHYRNDEVGASAHAPAMLLKTVSNTVAALPPSNRCSRTCATTSGSIASRCAASARSTDNGSCSRWSTTSRSGRSCARWRRSNRRIRARRSSAVMSKPWRDDEGVDGRRQRTITVTRSATVSPS